MAENEEPSVRAAVAAADPNSLDAERDRWLAMYQNSMTALAMIRQAVESFGPVPSLESEEATLALRGPEPVHEAEAIVEALIRVKAALHGRRT